MSIDLDSLESKIDRVLAVCRDLHADNRLLREQVTSLDLERQALASKIEAARGRLESLMAKLPEEG